jgi:hypothetical protein
VRLLLPIYILIEVGLVVLALGIAVWGFFFWDRRYRGAAGGDGFEATEETFRDPTTGRMMRVYFDSRTGRRQYRESGEAPLDLQAP